jgi:hypothetical protein
MATAVHEPTVQALAIHDPAIHDPAIADPTIHNHSVHDESADAQRGPTAAQLRRFIKSRPYVPLHELRRRFELNGDLDEVSRVELPGSGVVFVGLPQREAEFLASLVRDGDIGVELSQDPTAPIVVGVFPMRPITRG